MSVEVVYSLPRVLSLAEVSAIYQTAKTGFVGSYDMWRHSNLEGTLRIQGPVPVVNMTGVVLTYLDISGSLPQKAVSHDALRGILDSSMRRWDKAVWAQVECLIQEHDSVQTRNRCSEISVGLRVQGTYFRFAPAWSRTSGDPQARRELFLALIERLGLPMRLEDTPKGYILEHTAGGWLWATGGTVNNTNEQVFFCGIPEADLGELLRLQEQAVKTFASKVFGYRWSFVRDDDRGPPSLATDLYQWLVEQQFPAERIEMTFLSRLESMEGLEAMRVLAGPRGKFRKTLCGFSLPDKHHAELDVITRQDGHYLELNLTNPEELPRIEQALGVRWVEKEASAANQN